MEKKSKGEKKEREIKGEKKAKREKLKIKREKEKPDGSVEGKEQRRKESKKREIKVK